MSSIYTTPAVLSGFFKDIFASEQINLIPDNAILQKLIPFVSSDKETGNKYVQNVVVTHEHGVSYATADGGAFALSDSISMNTQSAEVRGSQMLLRSALSYDTASKASTSKKAFAKATSMIVESMSETMAHRLEVAMLYGNSAEGLGNGDTGASNGTKVTLTIDAAQFAPGIWTGKEGAKVAIADASGNVKGPFKILNVDYDNRTIDLGVAVETNGQDAGNGALADIASQADVQIYFFGSVAVGTGKVFREMVGLENIITTAGTLFNINNANYGLWKGNVATVSGEITMPVVVKALGKPIAKGLNEDVVCLVHPDVWAKLASDLAALRRLDSSYDRKKGENGVESLVYHSQNGKIEIISHSCVKKGHIFVIPPKRFKRIGSIDVSFKTPGKENEIFLQLPNHAGYELRAYTDQALFPEAVAKCLLIKGFTLP
jgi:hypothetical protein